jgi:hypothetical protein
MMMSHVCPSAYVGVLGTFFGFFNALGMLTATFLKSKAAQKYWYLYYNLPTVFELCRLVIICFFLPYESPYYVFGKLRKNQIKENKTPSTLSIQTGNSAQNKTSYNEEKLEKAFINNPEVNILVSHFYSEENQLPQKKYLFMIINKYYQDRRRLKGIWKTAFSVKFRKQLLIGLVLNCASQMTGISALSLYTKHLFQMLKYTDPELLVTLGGNINKA